MKRMLCSILLLVAGLVRAGLLPASDEFLGVIPDRELERLVDEFTVIGQTDNGALVIGTAERWDRFSALKGRLLDKNPRLYDYWRVHLVSADARAELARLGAILDFDGKEYIVRRNAEAAPNSAEWLLRVKALPAMVGPVRLEPLVLKKAAPLFPPVVRDPLVEGMVAAVRPESVLGVVRRLQQYRNRYSTGDSCRAAANWIANKLQAYGCDSVYLQYHTSGHAPNVIGIKYGTSGQRNPYAIVCGHFDSYAATNAPGADDNASGTAAVIEACRVMRDYQFAHDVRYIAFSGEEFGLYGSAYYASRARSAGDSILGVFNFDMIGYVDAAPENLELVTKTANPPCRPFSEFFAACADTYTTLLTNIYMVSDNQNSDHGPFWNNGYLAFCGIEDFWPVNPWYHTAGDSIGAGYNDNGWCTLVIKAAVAALATISEPLPLNVPRVSYFRNRIDDAAGNNNQHWDPAESIGVYLTLRNSGMVTAHNVVATISTADSFVTLYNTVVAYGDINGQETAAASVAYTMAAAANTPREHIVSFVLTIAAAETTWLSNFSLQVGEYLITDPVPDGPRTPPLYWAYDDIDVNYPEHPTYNWFEINSIGTRIAYSQNDEVRVFSLPVGFGPLKYYGNRYTQISISADGWFCPGNYTTGHYSNTPLPNASVAPGMVCLNWDDLYPVSGGGGYGNVYYYHDAENHRFVIEYDSVAYYGATSIRDKFQAFIYDTTVVTPSGDNAIVVQYKTAARTNSSTIGLQDPSRTIAIQLLYNGSYAHGAGPIVPCRAIKYVASPPTGIAEARAPEAELPLVSATRRLSIRPTVLRQSATIEIGLHRAGRAALQLLNQAGQPIKNLVLPVLPAGTHRVSWDLRGMAAGVYFVRLQTEDASSIIKTVVLSD